MSRFRAPWSTGVRVMSALVSLLLVGVAVLIVSSGTNPVIALLPVVSLLACALFAVRGYELQGTDLLVLRLLGSTRLDLRGLAAAWSSPAAMRRSWRLFGNGGLFAISGLFRNKTLGFYRALATDPSRSVVLELPRRTWVVTPEDPEAFLDALRRRGFGAAIERGESRGAET